MSILPTTRTGQEVASHVKRQFGDEAGVQISDADILTWINSGQLEIADRNKVLKAVATTDVVAGQADYVLSNLSVMQIEALHYNGGILRGYELAQAQEHINNITGGTGDAGPFTYPVLWYQWGTTVTLWPTPAEGITNGLKIYYTKHPTDLSDLTATLALPDKYYNMICAWVLAKAYELDEDYQASENQMQRFDLGLDLKSEEERTLRQITYPTITIVE